MKGKLGESEALSIDSGVVLAYLLGEDLGELVRDEILSEGRMVHFSRTAASELFYILCRRRGERFARETLEAVLRSGRVSVAASDDIDVEAGAYKCARSISLADCYVLAVAKVMNATAVFARREADMGKEADRKPFDVDVLFLENMTGRKQGKGG